MYRTLTVNEYRSVSTSRRHDVRLGRNRMGQPEHGVQVTETEGSRPLNLSILPFVLERRGSSFLGQDTFHFVRVYEDGREERV